MTIRRYQWGGNFSNADLADQVPPGVTATIQQTNPLYTDIELQPTPPTQDTRDDLDGYMASIGWTFVEEDPTGPLPSNSAQLLFGNESISTTDTVRYMSPGWDDNISPTVPYQMTLTRGGTLKNLRVRQGIPGSTVNDVVYTVRVNGVPTILSVTMDVNVQDGSNLANSVQVNAGDLLDIEVTKPDGGTGNPAPNDVVITLEYA